MRRGDAALRRFAHALCAALLLALLACMPQAALGADQKKNLNVIYVEGGPYVNYQQTLAHTARGLEKNKLILNGRVPIPAKTESAQEMWQWLSEHAGGRIRFLKDGFYSAGWNADMRKKIREDILTRIRERKDVDMIIAMGTWSGLDMAELDIGIPVFSMSVTDAVAAGIVSSVTDSGKDNVHACLEPGRFRRQLMLFHAIFQFKTLGVPYEDTPDGRSTAAMDEIEQTAAELGFKLVTSTAPLDLPDPEQTFANLSGCISELAGKADALYLTYASIPKRKIPDLIAPAIRADIPTFSQEGPQNVEYGVLMSLAQTDFSDIGKFEADAMAAVAGGKKPREVGMVFEPELGLAVNLKTAMQIGWNPPLEILAAVDVIYNRTPAQSK